MPVENIHSDSISIDQDLRSPNANSIIRSTSAQDYSSRRRQLWTSRPKSTPLSAGHRFMATRQSQKIARSEMANISVVSRAECDRVHQLEHEPTRRHRLENHLPLKKAKPPLWQKGPEASLIHFQVGPGYILSRSKTKNYVTIKDEFFEPTVQKSFWKNVNGHPERDDLIVQLQQQISDLTLYLEEERLNHKQTKQKAEDFLRDRIDQMNLQFQNQIRVMKDEQMEELLKQKQSMEAQHKEVQDTMEKQIRRMAKDIEFLQSAFESYKGTLNSETTQKWSTREDEQKLRFAEEKQKAIDDLKTKLIQERNQERANMVKEHQKTIETLRKENKREMDNLIRRFSNAAADIEKLRETTAELEETKSEVEKLKDSCSTASQQLTNVTNQLTDAKVRILQFEERFEDKVSRVEDKYKNRLQELMTQNTELKRIFVQKCVELYDEKADSEYKSRERVTSAKETMEKLIKSKQRANLSFMFSGAVPKMKGSKSRPLSAPGTRNEAAAAHETTEEVDIQSKPDNTRPNRNEQDFSPKN